MAEIGGGTTVDDEFQKYLEKEYTKEAVDNFVNKAPLDALDFHREYEIQKRQISLDSNDELRITIPSRFVNEVWKTTRGDPTVQKPFLMCPVGDLTYHTHIKADKIKEFFNPALEYITKHINFILRKVPEIKLIILVGGFAESAYLRKKFQEKFRENIFLNSK